MNILRELRRRFAQALEPLATTPQELRELVDMIRPAQDARFGDYQANCAMPLGKRLGKPPREIAGQLIDRLDVADLCEPPTIAGPGFVNLKLRDDFLTSTTSEAAADPRVGVLPVESPRTVVLDYSAPNVAKPMHVGHVRSTVIGDSLYRTLKFLGHHVTSDNHIGDWGTQFGMIIFGYRHFLDKEAYARSPVDELGRLYREVNQLVDYHDSCERRKTVAQQIVTQQAALPARQQEATAALEKAPGDKKAAASIKKELQRFESALANSQAELAELDKKIARVQGDSRLALYAAQYPRIGADVLAETAKLHEGDSENLRLWREFMPPCLAAIEAIYRRLSVTFDQALGESFYHSMLADVVGELLAKGIARESEGATCVFLEGSPAPMIVRKQDGAFLYATTDLATIRYRMREWQPDAILYVVDHRQSLHFEQLFATARLWGYDKVELAHVSFGTVLGDDGRPFKTRSGDTVGLSSLLDEAVRRAERIVSENDDSKPDGPELPPAERSRIAEAVGIASLKYADLSQNRTSDYVFSYDKMLAMNGNTATYMQYAYARVRSIFRRGQVDAETLRASRPPLLLSSPAERALAIELLRFSEALDMTVLDYRPNQLTAYLFDLANCYSTFFEQCPVLKAPSPELRASRLLLCDLTARTLELGLGLLGIPVIEKM